MSEDLKRRCARLTTEEKLQLMSFLSTSIQNERDGIGKTPLRASILLGELGSIYGRAISYYSRDPRDVWARTMVAYQMVSEGYSLAEIGRQLNKDHSTIVHLRHKMEDALAVPQAYRDILPIWNEFQTRISYDFHERPN